MMTMTDESVADLIDKTTDGDLVRNFWPVQSQAADTTELDRACMRAQTFGSWSYDGP